MNKKLLLRILPVIALLILTVAASCNSSPPSATSTGPSLPPGQTITDPNLQMPPYMNPENWAYVPRTLVDELKDSLDAKKKVLLVDIRYVELYELEHIPVAINVETSKILDGKWTPTGALTDPIVLYCN
jgi:hypothetical protein